MPPRDPRTSQAAAPRTAEAIAPVRLAVARTTMPEDPTDPGALRESGAQVRQFMHEAAAAGARLAQFPEGAITYPGKYVMSSGGPGALAEADWSRIDWDVMREEAGQVAALAGQLGIWTVFGSLHPLTPPSRPHNSLYVVTPEGRLLTRYVRRDSMLAVLRTEGFKLANTARAGELVEHALRGGVFAPLPVTASASCPVSAEPEIRECGYRASP